MKEKITFLMKSEGLTTTRLAEILEIQPSAVSHLVSGRNKPGYDLLQRILRRFPKINPDWLLLDADEPFRLEEDSPASQSDGEQNGALGEGLNGDQLDPFGIKRDDLNSEQSSAHRTQSSPSGAIRAFGNQKKEGKSPIFVVVFYDDGSCENFSML